MFQRDHVDLGFDLNRQIDYQMGLSKSIEGTKKSIEEMSAMRDAFEDVVSRGKYDRFESAAFFFEGDISIISSSAFQAEYEFSGEKLIDLWDLSLDAQILSHSVLNTHSGGAIIFTWLAGDNAPAKVVSSFEAIADADMAIRLSPKDPMNVIFVGATGVAHYFADRYDDAIRAAEECIRMKPGLVGVHRLKCSALAQSGRISEAQATLEVIRNLQPDISASLLRRTLPYSSPEFLEKFIDGLCKAGLPE